MNSHTYFSQAVVHCLPTPFKVGEYAKVGVRTRSVIINNVVKPPQYDFGG